jgi:hypothetical protein
MLENGYGESTLAEAFGGKTIVTEDLGYLPLSLPYQNADKAESFDDISDKYTDSVTIRLYGNSADGKDYSGSDSIDYTYADGRDPLFARDRGAACCNRYSWDCFKVIREPYYETERRD